MLLKFFLRILRSLWDRAKTLYSKFIAEYLNKRCFFCFVFSLKMSFNDNLSITHVFIKQLCAVHFVQGVEEYWLFSFYSRSSGYGFESVGIMVKLWRTNSQYNFVILLILYFQNCFWPAKVYYSEEFLWGNIVQIQKLI
jgi:hypothetical protein